MDAGQRILCAIVCVGVLGFAALAWAGESELLDLQIQLLDQELSALHRQQAAIDQELAAPRERMQLERAVSPSLALPPRDRTPWTAPPPLPPRSMRPPWLQPADQFSGWSSLSPSDQQRMFCLAPNDCYLERMTR